MVEFGEKLKQLREKSGMTQQTLADHLYVTRQAVSRWECGARYPDLLTTKKIAQILEVSIDELVSGEELQKNIEKEAVLAKPIPNLIQTMLYTFAAVTYLIMCIYAVKSLVPNEALRGTSAGEITIITITSVVQRLLCFIAVTAGLVFSILNKLTPKKTGIIMSAFYGIRAVEFVITYIDMQMRQNGYMPWTGWIDEFLVYVVSFICIMLYFYNGKWKIPSIIIYGIAALSTMEILYTIRLGFRYMTDLSFAVRTVSCMGRLGLVLLLVYQTYVFARKIKKGYQEI